MDKSEALQEARRRWGLSAFANPWEGKFEVGTLDFPAMEDMRINTYGTGDTWEAAFADADLKEGKP